MLKLITLYTCTVHVTSHSRIMNDHVTRLNLDFDLKLIGAHTLHDLSHIFLGMTVSNDFSLLSLLSCGLACLKVEFYPCISHCVNLLKYLFSMFRATHSKVQVLIF